MKIQYCSDLHLEFKENAKYIDCHPIERGADILLLAGDITLLWNIEQHKAFFDYVSDNFTYTYWIPGNHEYYKSDVADYPSPLKIEIRDNVFLVNQQVFDHEDVSIICCTLWSHVQLENEYEIQRNLSDFHIIQNEGKRLTVADFNRMHQSDLTFLERALKANEGRKKIVVTHHVPTLMHYPKQYINSPINQAFATELHDLILTSGASAWIYGHHHTNTPEFKIGGTTLHTNQLGYVSHYEHGDYRKQAIVKV
ncbi:metallophosphoesterase [Flavipsychrobacter stenotrophus]|uniref:Metallophosphoesterase n=1 Tax=Flavipsychrobacter stenotrophus TaxID=2077091 RepID=A0A2S7T1S1_9BACT|nr:metallophosphoesterase [Flavipsychrobacter stenotrophus]PQJ12811.1 metallophosphoesterase [Flavipsychrobacter stenotrophus]